MRSVCEGAGQGCRARGAGWATEDTPGCGFKLSEAQDLDQSISVPLLTTSYRLRIYEFYTSLLGKERYECFVVRHLNINNNSKMFVIKRLL